MSKRRDPGHRVQVLLQDDVFRSLNETMGRLRGAGQRRPNEMPGPVTIGDVVTLAIRVLRREGIDLAEQDLSDVVDPPVIP